MECTLQATRKGRYCRECLSRSGRREGVSTSTMMWMRQQVVAVEAAAVVPKAIRVLQVLETSDITEGLVVHCTMEGGSNSGIPSGYAGLHSSDGRPDRRGLYMKRLQPNITSSPCLPATKWLLENHHTAFSSAFASWEVRRFP